MEENLKEAADISIVIVCWNNKSYLEPCLQSIYQAKNQAAFEILIVDNGSTDGSQALIREQYPQIRLIENGQNVGLSRASNQGIEVTSGRYILLYNNDTLMEQGALDKMVQFMDEHPDAGAAGGRLINPDGSFQSDYCGFPTIWTALLDATQLWRLINKNYPSYPDSNEVQEVDWISSACLVLRRTTIDQVGMLDEDYFLYGDEMDLQYRIKKAGWKIYFMPDVTTVHFGSVSLNRWRKRKLFYRGILLFNFKNGKVFRAQATRIIFLFFTLIKIAIWIVMFPLGKHRQRAKNELNSLMSVLNLCIQPYKVITNPKVFNVS